MRFATFGVASCFLISSSLLFLPFSSCSFSFDPSQHHVPEPVTLKVHPPQLELKYIPNPRYEELLHQHKLNVMNTDHADQEYTNSSLYLQNKFVTETVLSATIIGCASIDFSASVYLGTQGPFQLIVDTGSTTLAVASNSCTNCGVSPLYTPTKANLIAGGTITATYGDGASWTGNSYTETVTVGGATAKSVIASIDSMGASGTQTPFFRPTATCTKPFVPTIPNQVGASQGIIGYAYNGPLARGTTSQFFGNFITQTAGNHSNMFAIKMCRNTGTVWNGGYDPASYTGQLFWTPIIKELYYVVHLQDVGLAPSATFPTSPTGFTSLGVAASAYNNPYAVFDSGTSLMVLPTAAATALQNALYANTNFVNLFGSNFYVNSATHQLACITPLITSVTTVAQVNAMLPPLQLTITDANGANPLYLQLSAVSSYLMAINNLNGGNTILFCPGFQAGSSITILGWTAMNQFTIVHDIGSAFLGFGSSNCAATDATSSPGGQLVGGTIRTTVPSNGPVPTIGPHVNNGFSMNHPSSSLLSSIYVFLCTIFCAAFVAAIH